MSPHLSPSEELADDRLPPAVVRALDSVAIVDATRAGRIEFKTRPAMQLLEAYFPSSNGLYLPEKMVEWLKKLRLPGSVGVAPLVIERGEKQLLVKIVGEREGHLQLVLEEKIDGVSLERLKALGLTAREAEVLLWIARGKATGEIAAILACSCNTVAKHTQRILAKLGAESRTVAAAIALHIT